MGAAFAWQQLTELVAIAVGVPVGWTEALDEYYDKRTGAAFDPVRVNDHAGALVRAFGLRIKRLPNATRIVYGAGLSVVEYHQVNGGDADKSFRLAVCRAILELKAVTND